MASTTKNKKSPSVSGKSVKNKTGEKGRSHLVLPQQVHQHVHQAQQYVHTMTSRMVRFEYWGSGIVTLSVLLFLYKGWVLWTSGVVEVQGWNHILSWYIGRFGNDVLYMFLIWVLVGAATYIELLRLRRFALIPGLLLAFFYVADTNLIYFLHSRFVLGGLQFMTASNAGPYLWYGILTLVGFACALYMCVIFTTFFARYVKRHHAYNMLRWALAVVVLLFGASFIAPFVSAFQKNIIQVYISTLSRTAQKTDKPYVSYIAPSRGTNTKQNIIVVFAESFSSIDSAAYGSKKTLLPGFDTIARDGIVYENFIANGCTSDTSHIAFLQGIEPWETSSSSEEYSRYTSPVLSLPQFMKQQGYDTTFVSTAPLGFLSQKDYLVSQKFDTIVGSEKFLSRKKYVFRAAPDEALYQETLQQLDRNSDKKHFMMLETISSHKPYNTPAGDTEEAAFRYADEQLLLFYRALQKRNYFDNGILIVVGDHRKMQALQYEEIEKRGAAAYGKAVMAVVGEGIPRGKKMKKPVQHSDIHYSLKRLVGEGVVDLNTRYNDILGSYVGREEAVRYCQYVDRQYVATRQDGATWAVQAHDDTPVASYIRSARTFQMGTDMGGNEKKSDSLASRVALGQTPWTGLVRFAHQGDTSVSPPNSLAAFHTARERGAEGVEMDVSFTKDGYPVVIHGPDLGRISCVNQTYQGKNNVADFLLQELKDDCKLYNKQVVLTLQEVLEKLDHDFPIYNVDIKLYSSGQSDYVATMIDSLRSLGLTQNVIFSSSSPAVKEVLRQYDDIMRGWELYDVGELEQALTSPYTYVLMPGEIVSQDVVKRVLLAKKKLIAFTINDPLMFQKLYQYGVRHFITDDVGGVVRK